MEFTLDRSKHQFFLDFADLGHSKSHQVVFDSEKNLWYLVISECPDKFIAIEQFRGKPELKTIRTDSITAYYLEINGKSYYLCHFNNKHVDQYQPVLDQFYDFDSPPPKSFFELDQPDFVPDSELESESDEEDFQWCQDNKQIINEFLGTADPTSFLRAHCTSKIIKCGIGLGLQRIGLDHPNRDSCVKAWQQFEI